jgi:hypothetical protein
MVWSLKYIIAIVGLIVIVILPCLSIANISNTQQKITASDGAAGDQFGWSVSISGDYAIVGAQDDDDKGVDSGSAYIFERTGSSWTEVAKLTPSDGRWGHVFGWSVSISGDFAIVSAVGDYSFAGAAYIFERTGSIWTEVDKLTASDRITQDYFGNSVSISGNYAIVGSLLNDVSGAAYIFERTGSSWTEVDKLSANDGATGDYFGYSVSISGNCAIVGAYEDDDKGEDSGSAYIFEKTGGTWIEVAKLTASDGAAGYNFGLSVCIDSNYAVVSAFEAAYIFERIGNSWTEVAKFTVSGSSPKSVSISGNYAIVGASGDDDNGFGSGAAYIFERIGSSWIEVAKLTASDGAAYDFFGYSVSISDSYAIAGARHDDDNGSNSGSAYTYIVTNQTPNQPPSTPVLSSPSNNATDIDPNNVFLEWNPSTDPDGDEIEYCVTVNEDAEPDNIPVYIGCDDQIFTFDTSFTLPDPLETGKTYYWAVWAKDVNDNWSPASEWWSFDIHSGPSVTIASISPAPVDGTLPVGQGVTITFSIINAPTDDEIHFELKRDSVPDDQTEPDGANWWRASVVVIADIDWDNQTQSIRAVIPFCLAPGDDWRFWGEHVSSGARTHSNETFNISGDLDSDGDALPDTWECHGVEYDPNSQSITACTDGDPDIDLPTMGANPGSLDIFVEIDWMEDATYTFLRPKTAALEDVVTAFANAPIDNLDGTTGINLHLDYGQGIPYTFGGEHIPFSSNFDLGTNPNDPLDWSNFDSQIKNVYFSDQSRRRIFHYCVFLNRFNDTNYSGYAYTPGNEFIVALGNLNGGTRQQQAGTLMHELGHNLGLRHGGDDSLLFKPNYLSVMNYSFQMTGLWKNGDDGIMDYSRIMLPSLSEVCLNESDGLNGGVLIEGYGTKFYTDPGAADLWLGSNEHFVSDANGPINWNRDLTSNDACVMRSINDFDPNYPDTDINLLRGFDDWANLIYDGGGTLGPDTGIIIVIEEPHPEIDSEAVKKILPYPPSGTSINVMPNAAAIEWKPSNLEIVSYYNVYRKTINTDFQLIRSTEDSFFEDHNLISCGIVIYAVSSVDIYGNESEILEVVEVDLPDTTPPEISLSVSPDTLWPPNHKMKPVTVTADASDNCYIDPVCQITTVESDEPINGNGDGDTEPDWDITGDLTAHLRSERSGTGDGRQYTITVECTDNSGNKATAQATVTVPHDKD